MWRDFPQRVADATGTTVIVYSRRGYGQSDPLPGPRAVDYMHGEAQDVLPKLLRALGVERPLLVGHSDGASIALAHAERATFGDWRNGRPAALRGGGRGERSRTHERRAQHPQPPCHVMLVRSCCLSWWRSIASAISRSSSTGYSTPEAAHSFEYMLIVVKPGIAFRSFT